MLQHIMFCHGFYSFLRDGLLKETGIALKYLQHINGIKGDGKKPPRLMPNVGPQETVSLLIDQQEEARET